MNLKFWKKMPSQEEADETPDSPGLFARMKMRVSALTGRLKSPPPFQAEVADEADVSEAVPTDTDADSPEPATKTGLLARARSSLQWVKAAAAPDSGSRTKLFIGAGILLLVLLCALGFAVWKVFLSSPVHDTPPPETAADGHTIPPSQPIAMPISAASAAAETDPASSPAVTPSESALDALEQKKAELQAQLDSHTPASAPAIKEHTSEATAPGHTVAASAVPLATSHTKSAASPAPSSSPPITAKPSAETNDTPETEIAKLKREKAELQKKLNELRNEKRHATAASRLHGGSAPALGGSMTVPSNDPKATADTLKTAIDAMNAGTGDYQKKPEK